MSTIDSSTLTGFRYFCALLGQIIGGFSTAVLLLYAFFLYFSGPEFFLGYYSVTFPGLLADDPFVAGFIIIFGVSPVFAVAFAIVRRKYGTRDWMKGARSAFFTGLLLGLAFVAFYIALLLIALAPPGSYGPGSGGGGGGL